MSKIRILVADDHGIVRKGLRFLLDRQPDMEVVGEASEGREVVRLSEELTPNVIIMDVAMPQLNGIDAAAQIIKSKSEYPHHNAEHVRGRILPCPGIERWGERVPAKGFGRSRHRACSPRCFARTPVLQSSDFAIPPGGLCAHPAAAGASGFLRAVDGSRTGNTPAGIHMCFFSAFRAVPPRPDSSCPAGPSRPINQGRILFLWTLRLWPKQPECGRSRIQFLIFSLPLEALANPSRPCVRVLRCDPRARRRNG